MRTVSFDVPPQEVLTKDSVTVAVDAVGKNNYTIYYFLFLTYKNKIRQIMSIIILFLYRNNS